MVVWGEKKLIITGAIGLRLQIGMKGFQRKSLSMLVQKLASKQSRRNERQKAKKLPK